MHAFSYYFMWAMAALNLVGTGVNIGELGKPRLPVTRTGLCVFVALDILFIIACLGMKP